MRSISLRLCLLLVWSFTLCGAPIEILKLEGSVFISRDKGIKWQPLKRRAKVHPGEWIKTDGKSLADFRLQGGSLVRIPEKSVALVDKLAMEKGAITIWVDVREGRILAIANKPADASKFEIKTPSGVCGARGTNTFIEADHHGTFRCIEGELWVIHVSPVTDYGGISLKKCEEATFPKDWRQGKSGINAEALDKITEEFTHLKRSAGSAKKK